MEVLVATDFFTVDVWTLGGLVTYYVLFFIHLGSHHLPFAQIWSQIEDCAKLWD